MKSLVPSSADVTVDGVPLGDQARSALTELVVEQRSSTPACLTIVFLGDGVGVGLDERSHGLLPDAATVVCSVDSAILFDGVVAARTRTWDRDRGTTLAVRAYDRLHRWRERRRIDAYHDAGPVDIIEKLAAEHGLSVEDRSGVSWSRRLHHQYGETDLAFARRLLAPSAGSIHLDGDCVVVTADPSQGHAITLDPIEALSALSVDERADNDQAPMVASWHPDTGHATGLGPADGSAHAGHQLDDDAADGLRRGLENRLHRQRVVATGTTKGDPTIRPGAVLDIPDPADRTGRPHRLLATTATHRLHEAGFTTTFSTEPTDAPPSPIPAATTLGRVVDLDDPERRNRVRLALVAFDDIQTGWLPVLGLGSGHDRGVVAVPATDDLALVIGPIDDPANGVVLGGLPAGSTLTGDPTEGGRSRRIVARLPNGARLLLDDDTVEVDDGRGSTLRFTDDAVRLRSAVDLEIAAPGQAMVLTADTIDFRRS